MSSGGGRNGDLDPEKTRLTSQLSADNDKTNALTDLGAVAELRAALQTPGPNDKLTLPLYAMADTVIVGRGTACDWQLDDVSLSRKHATFRWSGLKGGLTVEDLGSANGTRVNGRPCRGETKVLPGEPVQLGTVIISLQLKTAKPATADEQATRLVQQPDQPISAEESEPSLTPLPPAKTVLRPQPDRGAANQHAQVFRPEKDAARPDEPTRGWDTRAVLVRAPEKAFDPEWLDQIKNMWRTNRRPLVLAGAAAWIALLLIVWASVEKGQQEEDDSFPTAMPTAKAPKKPATPPKPPTETATKPVVTPIPTPTPTPPVETPPAADDPDRAAAMEQAIAAYDQGRMTEALSIFRRLAADPKDPTSKFMVDLIESRQGATP